MGLFKRGKFFIPTIVNKQTAQLQMGKPDQTYNTMYGVNNYLVNQQTATTLRMSHNENMNLSGSYAITQSGSNGQSVIMVISPTERFTGSLSVAIQNTDDVEINSADTYSLNPPNENYILNAIGNNPNNNKDYYVYISSQNRVESPTYSASKITNSIIGGENIKYSTAQTPFITDGNPTQIGSNDASQLFKFVHMSDGQVGNKDIKISITNQKTYPDDWATFDVLIRKYNDTDKRPVILQKFEKLSLNPDDVNYIAKRIGDTYYEIEDSDTLILIDSVSDINIKKRGTYKNNSRYVYVVMGDGVANSNTIPKGFKGYKRPIQSFIDLDYITSTSTSNLYLGVDTNSIQAFNYANKIEHYGGEHDQTKITDDFISSEDENVKPFTMILQGGFDGVDDRKTLNVLQDISINNTYGFNFSNPEENHSIIFKACLQILSNKDQVDIQTLIVPMIDIYNHKYLVEQVLQFCKKRTQCYTLLNFANKGIPINNNTNFTNIDAIDDSFGSSFYPFARIHDKQTNKYVWLPPVIQVAYALGYTNRFHSKWSALAGQEQGLLGDIVQLEYSFKQKAMQLLQQNRINPLKMTSGNPAIIWGNLTLLKSKTPHPLDRLNARRAVTDIKKRSTIIGKSILFKEFTTDIAQEFKNSLQTSILYPKFLQGKLVKYDVITDGSVNTDEVIDNNMLIAKMEITLAKTIQCIVIDMNISNVNTQMTQS